MRARSVAALDASSGSPTGSARKSRVESLKHLRAGLAVRGACAPELLLDPPQRLLVAVEQLDLELLEAAGDTLVVEDGDRVVDDLGAVGSDAFAAGPEPRDRQQHGATKVRDEQFQHVVRWRAGPARRPRARAARCPASSFSCQSPFPFSTRCRSVMPRRAEPVVGRVVVRGDEEARLDRLAAELGQL